MKIWLKMLLAIILGLLIGFFIPDFKIFSSNYIFEFLAKLALNLMLYTSVLYVLVKSFLGFYSFQKRKIDKKFLINYLLIVFVFIAGSTIISIIFMNFQLFLPNSLITPKGAKIIDLNSFDKILLKIMNDNILTNFVGQLQFILPLIFVGFIFSLAAFYSDKKSSYFIDLIESFDVILNKIVRQVLELFPVGAVFVFATFIKSDSFSSANFAFVIKPLIAVIILSALVIFIYTLILNVLFKKNVFKFYLGFLGSGLIAFVTGNTAASLIPLTEHLKKNIGIKKDIADTLGPIGLILNRAGTVMVSTVILMTIIQIYTPDILGFGLQIAFLVLLFVYSFCLDGANDNGFLALVALILNFAPLHLEQESYLLFMVFVPIFSRIAIFMDVLSTSIAITLASKLSGELEERHYIDFI